MQGFACDGHKRFAERFVLCGVCVQQWCEIFGVGVPIDGGLSLANELTDAGTNHVDSDNRAINLTNYFDRPGGFENVALAVTGQVVVIDRDVALAKFLQGRSLGVTHGSNFGLGIGDFGDVAVHHHHGV